MPTPTYDLIASTTVASISTSVTFSSLPASGYRDLIVIVAGTGDGDSFIRPRFNGDSGNNYNRVQMRGTGSAAFSETQTNQTDMIWGKLESNNGLVIGQIFDYATTDKHKTVLTRGNATGERVEAWANRWASTSAITSIEIRGTGTGIAVGTVISIYGIAS
jgi:hypothetical protein